MPGLFSRRDAIGWFSNLDAASSGPGSPQPREEASVSRNDVIFIHRNLFYMHEYVLLRIFLWGSRLLFPAARGLIGPVPHLELWCVFIFAHFIVYELF